MFGAAKSLMLLLRSFALVSVVALGLLTILATGGGSSGDQPAHSFANAGRDVSVGIGSRVKLDGTGSNTPLGNDSEDDDLTYFWTVVSSPPKPEDYFPFPETYEIEDYTTLRPLFKPIIEGEYVVQLRVRFGDFNAYDTVSVFAYNSYVVPPIARAGPDQFVKDGALVILDGSGSYAECDYQGEFPDRPYRYSWYINEQPAAASSSLSATDIVNPRFVAEYDAADLQGEKPQYSLYQTRLHVINRKDWVSKPVHVNTFVFPSQGYVYPMPVAGQNQKVLSGSTVHLDGGASYDVDGRPLTYSWQFYARPGGSQAVLSGANTATPSFVADLDGIYVVHLQVNNGELSSLRLMPYDGMGYSTWGIVDYAGNDRVVITSVSGPTASVTDAGPDRLLSYTGPVDIPLDASGSYDVNGDQLYYYWALLYSPSGSQSSLYGNYSTQPDNALLRADIPGSYVIGLSTDDWEKDRAFQNSTLMITLTENTPPTANAGIDQAVTVGNSVILDGSASLDPDADSIGYSWSLAYAPGDWGYAVVNGYSVWSDWPLLSDGMAVAPSFTPDLNGEYRLLLTVNDGDMRSVADEVIITASGGAANSAPTANAGSDQSVTVGDTVMLNGNGSSDPDTDPLTYLWSIEIRPLGSSAALDDATSMTPSFVADVAGVYELQLIVNDGLLNSTPDTMTVTASVAGACVNPLTLVTSLPFLPGTYESATNIQIDASGADELSAVAAGLIIDADVYQAMPDGSIPDQANFNIMLPLVWEEISRTHSNPISDGNAPSFVVRNIADNIYYKLDVSFTRVNFEVQIDALSGCRCGSNAGDCP